MFTDESLITIIRQLVRHHGLEPDEVVSVFINATNKVVGRREICTSDIYEMVIEMLLTGEIL